MCAAELPVLRGLQKTLRAGDFAVTACLRHGRDIVAVYPGFKERVFGLAFDIGSTTVAAHLCDLAKRRCARLGRPHEPADQARRGSDEPRLLHHDASGRRSRADASRARSAGGACGGDGGGGGRCARPTSSRSTLAGNPIMHHLALGLDPTELGVAPFALTIDAGFDAPAREIGLAIAPGAYAHALPCIGGHVGADAAAVVLCEGPYLSDEIRLIVDVGTNAEIVLGNRHRLLACSSPTGPAFEGAQISCGQRAAPGAIERLRIDRDDARAALQGDRLRSLVGRGGLRRGHGTRPASPGFAARASSRRSPRWRSPACCAPDGIIDGDDGGAHAAHRRRWAHLHLS